MSDRADKPDLTSAHPRSWRGNLYVYPVVSRRARGLSIGINLNLNQACTFRCVYCQVDRRQPPADQHVDLHRLRRELEEMLELARSGRIWQEPPFSAVPENQRRINDIAFSGDGEPTSFRHFSRAVQLAADLKAQAGLPGLKIVVITNATLLHGSEFRRALPVLQACNGQVWAKLDAGTESYYRRMNASDVPFQRVLDNIAELARQMPVVIQTMLLRLAGELPPQAEIDAYVGRLRDILRAGGTIQQVQLYTIARPTASSSAEALTKAELDAIAQHIKSELPGLDVQTFYGSK